MRNRNHHIMLVVLSLAAACASGGAGGTGSGGDTFDLVVAGTTDVHGRLRGWNYETNAPDASRGLSRAATIVDSLRRAAPGRVILLDAGDLLQGNALTYVAGKVAPADAPHPVVSAMNAMKYDGAAIGNHEFNYGLPLLQRAISQSRFPFMAANALRPDGQPAFAAWTMVQRGEARIGIVGATTPGAMVWDRDNLTGRIVVKDVIPEVKAAVADVRAAGATIVLVTIHSGLDGPSSYDTVSTGVPSENVTARVAHEVPGVDLILYGHSHREVADTTINGVLLMQPRNWAGSVAVAHLALVRGATGWRVANKRSTVVQAAGHAEDPIVLAVTDAAHRATIAWVTAPIGRTPVAWRADSSRVVDTPLIDFILETQRKAAGADLASTAAFSLDASLDSGTITAARLQALYPYDNTLRAVRISGGQLKAYLEYSARYYRLAPDGTVGVDPDVPGYNFDIVAGADYTLDVSRPIGQRVTRLDFKGRAVAPTDSFTLALNNYRQTGGGGYSMLAGAPVVYDKQEEIRQLLLDEVRRRGTINPWTYFTRNWRIEPASAVGDLYRQLRRRETPEVRTSQVSPAAAPGAAMSTTASSVRATRPVPRLRVIATHDFHGALEPRPDATRRLRGGAAHLAAGIARERAGCESPACETLLLDGGDQFQGTPASNLAFGRPVVELFNAMGYAAAAVGNHEFDWGQDTLRARMRDAKYALLAANVRYADGRDVPWIRDDTLITRGALKIGVVGVATTLTPTTTRASNVADLRFIDPVPVVDSLARRLRARGADYVVVVAHEGAFCDRDGVTNCRGEIVEFANRLREPVDAIVSGHTHSLVSTVVNGIPIVQSRSSGTAFGVVDLGPDGSRPRVRDVLPETMAADPAVAALVQRAVARVAPIVDRRVATIADDLVRDGDQYSRGNLIADAMRAAGGGDVAVMNNGGIRATLRRGVATYGALFEVQPFANTLYRLTVSGAALRTYMERLVARRLNVHVSGIVVSYDSTAAVGGRVRRIRLANGVDLRADGEYTLVLNDFLATGGDGLGLSSAARRTEVLPVVDLDAFVTYLRTRPQPVRAPTDARFVLTAEAR
ncbi:MAG: 5'-nucleotidase C-terminal domain-containing protein [Gemmatimonadaceae bacterium]|nr:5'-nucleotidase C-terminal domain-containing protein [Gemmatimonadaceae bacterium]